MRQVFVLFVSILIFATVILTQNFYISTSECRVDRVTVTPIEAGLSDVAVGLSVPSKPSIPHRGILMRPKIDQGSVDAYTAYVKEGDMWSCYTHEYFPVQTISLPTRGVGVVYSEPYKEPINVLFMSLILIWGGAIICYLMVLTIKEEKENERKGENEIK